MTESRKCEFGMLNRATLVVCGLALWFALATGRESMLHGADIRRDEQVVFYPMLGAPVDDQPESDWELEIQACVFESGRNASGIVALREVIGLDAKSLSTDESRLCQQRLELFAVDHERGKTPRIKIGEKTHTLPASDPGGQIQAKLRLSHAEVLAASGGTLRELPFTVSLPKGDSRTIRGVVHLIPRGALWHVVSDIDDTIKISQVRDKKALVLNTFCRPFRPVPGMSNLYRSWAGDAVRFHYVSASPTPLYSPLAEFLESAKFPAGSMHLKPFRIKDQSPRDLLGSQEGYKRGVIEPLLKRIPHGRFILVGDSGEQDPVIYAGLARDYPMQVKHILIRNVTDEADSVFERTFAAVPQGQWQAFRTPEEIRLQPK